MQNSVKIANKVATMPLKLRVGRLMTRVMAIIYDSALILAVMFVITAVGVALNHGNAIGNPIYYGLIACVPVVFYIWFWVHGGQTLGMRAWRLKLQTTDGTKLTIGRAILRIVTAVPLLALAGLGLWCLLCDRHARCLYDRLSGTQVVRTSRDGQVNQSA